MADHTQIHQIIMNLITNAFHAMEQDGGTLGVSLKKTVITEPQCLEMNLRIGSYIVLSISDTGSGIDPAIMPRLFEPYFTTKTNGKGTGLGLSVVHGIVRDYSGHIDISSKPGEGTCFTVYLPVMDKEKQAVQISETDEIRGGTERILVVDDEEQITSMLEESLKRLGYTVTSQSTGNEALDTLTRIPDQFDLVISDVTMPGITGDKLVRKIHEIRPDIPVVLCTGFEGRLTKEEIQAFGVTDFLMKPISRKDLARSIRNVLDKQY